MELRAAEEAAYLRLGGELSGDELKRRLETADVEDAVDDRLAQLTDVSPTLLAAADMMSREVENGTWVTVATSSAS